MIELLIDAIRTRRVIKLSYEPGLRIIEPHAFGTGSNGQLLLRAFQVAGASASGEHVNWKLFRFDRIADLEMDQQHFAGAREGYKRGDSHMKGGIIAQL